MLEYFEGAVVVVVVGGVRWVDCPLKRLEGRMNVSNLRYFMVADPVKGKNLWLVWCIMHRLCIP